MERTKDMDAVSREASQWVSIMEETGAHQRSELVSWLFKGPRNLGEYLEMLEVEWALRHLRSGAPLRPARRR
jgi:ferric-dicitrate binding protein FerR (iron transport regulator)